MRRILGGFLAGLTVAVVAAASRAPRESGLTHETITVPVGDTLRTFFTIRTDSVLTGGHQLAVAAKCGTGQVYLRLSDHAQFVSGDTIDVAVTGCGPVSTPPPPPIDTQPTPAPPPVDTVPAPPVGSGEPSYSPTTGRLIFVDSMDTHTTFAALQSASGAGMRWFNVFTNTDPAETFISPGYGGSGKAFRQSYQGVDQESHTIDLINAPVLPDTTTEYFQYEGRVTPAGSLKTTVLAIKWIMGFHRDGNRVQFNTHDHLPCQYDHPGGYTVWQVYDDGGETACQANQPVGPYPADAFNGQWHRYTYQYKPNTAKGTRDGIARMWIDGVKVIDISAAAVGITPAGGYKSWCNWDDVDALSTQAINMFRWAGNLTTTTPAFTIDLDNFLWWHAR